MSLWSDIGKAWDDAVNALKGLPGGISKAVQSVLNLAAQNVRRGDWYLWNPFGTGYAVLENIFGMIDSVHTQIQFALDRLNANVVQAGLRGLRTWADGRINAVLYALASYEGSTDKRLETLWYRSFAALPADILNGDRATLTHAEHYAAAVSAALDAAARTATLHTVDAEATAGYDAAEDARLATLKDAGEVAKLLGRVLGEEDPLFAVLGTLAGDLARIIGIIEHHTGPHTLKDVIGAMSSDMGRLEKFMDAQLHADKQDRLGNDAVMLLIAGLSAAVIADPVGAARVTVDALEPVTAVVGPAVTGLAEGGLSLIDAIGRMPAAGDQAVAGLVRGFGELGTQILGLLGL